MTLAALFNGSSGLLANSAALDVVGNNLANLNTTVTSRSASYSRTNCTKP